MKKILITEDKEKEILDYLLTEAFAPAPHATSKAVKFLDDNIRIGEPTVDVNGEGEARLHVTFVQFYTDPKTNKKTDVRTMNERELVIMLDDKLKDVLKIKDKDDRKKFLQQVVTDWAHGTKSLKYGVLSVNYIK